MPNIKQPRRLEELALTGVGVWVAKVGEDLMPSINNISREDSVRASTLLASSIACLKELLEYNIPWMLYDSLAVEVFRSVSDLLERTKQSMGFRGSMARFISKMNVAVSLTEVLLTKNLTKLNLDEVPKMMRHMFYVKFAYLKGLVLLNLGSLSGGWKTADMEPTIISGLESLHNLKYLTINYDCTDNILEAICNNCPKLQSLDVTSSKNISNQSVTYLIRCLELRSVQLYRTGVTLEGFTKLLLNCHKMEDLGRCDELGRVLEYIDMTNSAAGPFALKKYVSRYSTSTHLQLLVNLCPMVYSISLFHNSMLSDLTILIALSELSELKLLSCDFFADQVKQVLELKGCNIVSLHLEHVDQLDLNALMYISQFCRSLKSLTLYNCVLVQHTSLYTRRIDWSPFHGLERLMCVCEGTEEQMEFLLGNCVNIRYIHIGTACPTTDRLFDKVLDKNPLLFLEELRIIRSENLTMMTVSRLMTSCGQLRVLTELECWKGLSENDLEYIHIEVNLTDDHFKPGKKLYNRIQERLRCFKKFTLILRWEPNDERICPSSIAKYFVEKGLQIEVCTPKLRVMRQYTNTIPVPNTDDIISLVEWMGMIAIGGDLNPENSHISSYSYEQNHSVAGHVTAFNISGLFTSHHLQRLRQISREIIEKKVSSWVAVTAQCFSNTPSTRELKETKNYVPSDRILTVIYCGEDEIFCESFKSN